MADFGEVLKNYQAIMDLERRVESRRQRFDVAKDKLKQQVRRDPDSVLCGQLAKAYEAEKGRLDETEGKIAEARKFIAEAGYEFLLDEE